MSTTVTVKASVSDMTPKVTNTEGIVIRTQGLAQAIDSRLLTWVFVSKI